MSPGNTLKKASHNYTHANDLTTIYNCDYFRSRFELGELSHKVT